MRSWLRPMCVCVGRPFVRAVLASGLAVLFLAAPMPVAASAATPVVSFQFWPSVSIEPQGLATGPGGKVWFTDTDGNGTGRVGYVDPASGHITVYDATGPGERPAFIAASSGDLLWFSDSSPHINSVSASTGQVTRRQLPTGATASYAVAVAGDGGVWFVEGGSNNLARLDPSTGHIDEVATTHHQPIWDVAIGPDGKLWFLDQSVLGRVDLATRAVTEVALPSPGESHGLAWAPDGSLWYGDYYGNAVVRFDSATQTFASIPIPTPFARMSDMTLGSDNALWFTESKTNKLGRVDPVARTVSEFQTPIAHGSYWIIAGPNKRLWFSGQSDGEIGAMNPTNHAASLYPYGRLHHATSVVIGPDQAVWTTENGQAFPPALSYPDDIVRIDPVSHKVKRYRVRTANGGVGRMVVGNDQRLWFTEATAGRIGRLDPATGNEVEWNVSALNNLTVAPNGRIWFNRQTGLAALDATGKVVATVDLAGHQAQALAATADGAIWFTSRDPYGRGEIGRLDPTSLTASYHPVPSQSNSGANLIIGSDGNLWWTEYGGNQAVVTADVHTGLVSEYPLDRLDTPLALTSGQDGNIWFSNGTGGLYQLVQFKIPSHEVNRFAVPQDFSVGSLAATSDGFWFGSTDSIGKATVSF